MAKTVRPGTTLRAIYGGRVRHVVVEEVTDQDNIKVRVGSNTQGTEFNADRVASTDTRGTIFQEE